MSQCQYIKQEAFEANMQLPKLNIVLFTFDDVSTADRKLNVYEN
jgi:L-ribulose-5-phosphate 4-epimerase